MTKKSKQKKENTIGRDCSDHLCQYLQCIPEEAVAVKARELWKDKGERGVDWADGPEELGLLFYGLELYL
jgi:hypothetical protein